MTEAFAHRIGAFRDVALPKSVLATARMRFLDYLGVTLAGARLLGDRGRTLAGIFGPGDSVALGMDRTCPALSAALFASESLPDNAMGIIIAKVMTMGRIFLILSLYLGFFLPYRNVLLINMGSDPRMTPIKNAFASTGWL